MQTFFKYIFVITVILFASCKKNDLPPKNDTPEEPVFYIKGNVNGLPVAINAGVDNYYMYSSYYQDANNVYVYKGELKQQNCGASCGYGITLLINDYKVSPLNGPMQPDSGLYIGPYQFNDGTPEPVEYNGSFTPIITGASPTYTWNYSDGMILNSTSGSRVFTANKTYSVALTLNNAGCIQTHTNEFRIGSPLQTNVSGLCNWTSSPTTYSFYAAPQSGVSFQWEFGDGQTSVLPNPIHTYTAGFGYYRARVKLHNSITGDVCYSYYQVPVSQSPVCHANYNSYFTPVPNIKALSSITVLVTDPSGNVYSTQGINQPVNNKIEIVSVENYDDNQQGQHTKKVKIKFNCDVVSGGNQLQITNGEAVIAVAYK